MPRGESPHAGKSPCHTFMATGSCKYGDSCKYSHGEPTLPAAESAGGSSKGKKKRKRRGKKKNKSKKKKGGKGKSSKKSSGSSKSSSSKKSSGAASSCVESLKGSTDVQTPKGSQAGG